ncbi:MAG: GIY-YIG nuclease family protein [Hyphomicrobiaceae bacterium]|nr:GIY-YIG nuclease family protein [Hyphomicrobiaceae bacterium]
MITTKTDIPPDGLLRQFKASYGMVRIVRRNETSDLPAVAGAYLLILGLREAILLTRPRASQPPLLEGWYVYAGSARGPGGIRARLARHLHHDKRAHWHVDQLTMRRSVTAWAVPLPGETECDLVSRLVGSGHFEATHPGFGSSDCNRCAAHLLMWRGLR